MNRYANRISAPDRRLFGTQGDATRGALRRAIALGCAAASVSVPCQVGAQPAPGAQHAAPTRLIPAEFPFPAAGSARQAGSSMQGAVQTVVLYGDPVARGLYSIVFKVAPDARIPAHSHSDDRSCFVTSGVWYFGYGESYSESSLRALPAGSHYTEPANVSHFAGTRSEGATAECTAIGPSETKFNNRADDPRR